MSSSNFPFLRRCFVWACLAGGFLACTTPAPRDDLTSPLDFQLPEGDELRMSIQEIDDGRLTARATFSVKRLAPRPLPGTGERVSWFETGSNHEPVDDAPLRFTGFSFQRVDAEGEVSLGYRTTEINGRAIDDLMMLDPPYIDLKAPLTLGSRWEFQARRWVSRPKSEEVMFLFRKTVQAKELSVVVPAGRYERCIRVVTEGVSERTFSISCGGASRERHILKDFYVYYCPGAGNVREYFYERYGDPGRPDPACPTVQEQSRVTAHLRAPAPDAPRPQ